MIRGFIDDSEQADLFVLAGWVTDYKTWDAFTSDWRAALDEEPSIDYFKHHEARGEPPTGQFAGWGDVDIDAKMQKLADVICRHEMYGVISWLNLDSYKTAFAGSVVSLKQLFKAFKKLHPFSTCTYNMSALVLQVEVDNGNTDQIVDIVFDEMEGLMAECIAFYDEIRDKLPEEKKRIAGSLTEANDKNVEALQAADFLAGQITSSHRLGRDDRYYEQMNSAHGICQSEAIMPSFHHMPSFVSGYNVFLSAKKIEGIARRRQRNGV